MPRKLHILLSLLMTTAALLVLLQLTETGYAASETESSRAENAPGGLLVNTDDDLDDGLCDAAHCSLREAINAANLQPVTNTILFDPGITPTIMISGVLPAITGTVLLDGDLGNGQKVVLDGTNGSGDALILDSHHSTIRNLVIHSFPGTGIVVNGTHNRFTGNLIGTDAGGTVDLGNGLRGIHVQSGRYNQIGGITEAERNLISGNGTSGIWLDGTDVFSNTIIGNFIGTNVSGTAVIRNDNHGIALTRSPYNRIGGTAGVTVGGPCTGACNLISGNGNGNAESGIIIDNEQADFNRIVGNFIGTDASGTQDLGNRYNGIYLKTGTGSGNGGPDDVQIGGTTPAERNLISGNNYAGIYLTAGAARTTIQGNYIGTTNTGTAALPNSQYGIYGTNSKSTLIGGTTGVNPGGPCTGACNLISGNGSTTSHHGVFLNDGTDAPVVMGNFIGVDVTGLSALPNAGTGLRLDVQADAQVGGATPAARNLIAGNGQHGLHFGGYSARDGLIQNNYIGVDATGQMGLGNSGHGLVQGRCKDCLIKDNIVSANGGNGMWLRHYALGNTAGVDIRGNLIGVAADGVTPLGNGQSGIAIPGTSTVGDWTRDMRIGGPNPGEGNVIAANVLHGIHFFDNGGAKKKIRNIVIQGNFIGTDAGAALNLGNGGHGILVAHSSQADTNQFGGPNPGEGNVIANNGLGGVTILSRPRQTIRGNQIYANGGLGIDLNNDGVTPNDLDDRDTGANDSLNFPVILAAVNRGSSTRLIGTYQGISNTIMTLDFYANITCDPAGYGEGQQYIGSLDLVTNDSGQATFNQRFALVPAGQFVVATATEPAGSTSEFSACTAVTRAAGAINGTVTDAAALPVAAAEVLVYQNLGTPITPTWHLLDVVTTTVAGAYEVPYLYTGDYGLRFTDPARQYAPEYYDDADGWTAVTPISVTDGLTTTNINAALAPGGQITGTVTLTDGTPLSDIVVSALWQNAGVWELANAATTVSGTYTIPGLGSGAHRIYFYDPAGVYGSEYYSDTDSLATAVSITVTKGQTTAPINAVLAPKADAILEWDETQPTGDKDCVIQVDDNGQGIVRLRRANPICHTVITTPPGLVSCPAGGTPANVRFVVGLMEFTLLETVPGSGRYTGLVTIDGTGQPDLTLQWSCGGTPQSVPVGGVQLFDPSGFITDEVTGQPVAGATVTLYQVPGWRARTHPADLAPHTCESNESKTPGNAWSQAAPVDLGQFAVPFSGLIDPAVNPQLTDGEGYYGWDVAAGCWYVVVEAEGYLTKVSPVVGVPSEVTDLDLTLVPLQLDLHGSVGGGATLDLAWTLNVAITCQYEVHQATVPYFAPVAGTLIATTPASSFTVAGVTGDTAVHNFFQVQAVNCEQGEHVHSNAVGEFEFAITPGG